VLLVGDADSQICGSPEEVHQGKRKNHLQTMMAIAIHKRDSGKSTQPVCSVGADGVRLPEHNARLKWW
jgi:hypothetical protein